LNQTAYDPLNEIIPFIDKTFGRDRLSFSSPLPTGYENRPLIREWFTQGFQKVKNGYICFINSDIIISPLWMNTAMAIFEAFPNNKQQVLIYGVRTDVHRRPGIFAIPQSPSNWFNEFMEWLGENARSNNRYGMDAFLVHSSFTALKWRW
jgi:hypothetical protein